LEKHFTPSDTISDPPFSSRDHNLTSRALGVEMTSMSSPSTLPELTQLKILNSFATGSVRVLNDNSVPKKWLDDVKGRELLRYLGTVRGESTTESAKFVGRK
jgi:hypothetical protein